MQGSLTVIPEVNGPHLDDRNNFSFVGTLYYEYISQCYVRAPPGHVPVECRNLSGFNAGRRSAHEESGLHIARLQELWNAENSRVLKLSAEIEALNRQIAGLQSHNRRLAHSSQPNRQTQQLSDTLALLKADLETRVEETNVKLRKIPILEEEVSNLEETNRTLKARVEQTNEELKKISTLKSEVSALEATNRILNRNNVQLKGQVGKLQALVKDNENKLIATEKQFLESTQTLSQSQEQWTERNSGLRQQMYELTELKKLEIQNIKDQLAGFMKLHQQKQEDFRAKYNELKELMDGFIRKASTELKAINSQLAKKDKKITTLELEVLAANGQCLEANTKCTIAKNTLDGARHDNNELSKNLAETREKLEFQVALGLSFAKESAQKNHALEQRVQNLDRLVQELIGGADETLRRLLVEATEQVAKRDRKIQDLEKKLKDKK